MSKLRVSMLTGCLLAGVLSTQLAAQVVNGPIKAINVPGKSPGKDSNAGIMAGGTLYLAGQSGLNADGSSPADFKQETAQAMANVQGVLHAAGLDYGNLVWINVYVTDPQLVDAMNDVYWKTIGSKPPARSVQIVGALAGAEKIEINGIAASTANRKEIWPAGWKRGPGIDPPGVQADDVLYISAMGGADQVTGQMPADFATEIKGGLENVKAVLAAAHMTMANVLFVNPFSSSSNAQGGGAGGGGNMNQIYASYFEFGNTPGRATITMEGLPKGQRQVYFCIAGADLSKRKSIRPINMEPSATASPGIVYDDTYYMSAKSGFIPDQGVITPDVLLQLRQTMRNLLDDLQFADMDFQNVVFSTAYLSDIHTDESPYLDLYATFFKNKVYPALTVLQQTAIRAGGRGTRAAAAGGAAGGGAAAAGAAPAAPARQPAPPSREQISFIAVRQSK